MRDNVVIDTVSTMPCARMGVVAIDMGSVATEAAFGGLIDVMILVVTFVNICFFWPHAGLTPQIRG